MYCNNCGKKNSDNAIFCTECGNRLDLQKKVVKKNVNVNENVNAKKQTSQPHRPNQQGATMGATTAKKNSKTGLIIALVIIIIAAAVGGFFFYQGKIKTVDVNLNDYIGKKDVIFKGEDGSGTASVDTKAVKKKIKKEYDEGFISKMQLERVMNSIENLKLYPTLDSDLTNGDKIKVEAEFSKNQAEKNHVNIKESDKSFIVKGLEEVKKEPKSETSSKSEVPKKSENHSERFTDGYIIPYSSTRLLSEDDLRGLSLNELALARNEIYARHGYEFKEKYYRDYFNSLPWYTPYEPEQGVVWNEFSEIERKNVVFIKNHE